MHHNAKLLLSPRKSSTNTKNDIFINYIKIQQLTQIKDLGIKFDANTNQNYAASQSIILILYQIFFFKSFIRVSKSCWNHIEGFRSFEFFLQDISVLGEELTATEQNLNINVMTNFVRKNIVQSLYCQCFRPIIGFWGCWRYFHPVRIFFRVSNLSEKAMLILSKLLLEKKLNKK